MTPLYSRVVDVVDGGGTSTLNDAVSKGLPTVDVMNDTFLLLLKLVRFNKLLNMKESTEMSTN